MSNLSLSSRLPEDIIRITTLQKLTLKCCHDLVSTLNTGALPVWRHSIQGLPSLSMLHGVVCPDCPFIVPLSVQKLFPDCSDVSNSCCGCTQSTCMCSVLYVPRIAHCPFHFPLALTRWLGRFWRIAVMHCMQVSKPPILVYTGIYVKDTSSVLCMLC